MKLLYKALNLFTVILAVIFFYSCNQDLGGVDNPSNEKSTVTIKSINPLNGSSVSAGDTIKADLSYNISVDYFYADYNYELVIFFKDVNGAFTSLKTGLESVNVFNKYGSTAFSFAIKDVIDSNFVTFPLTFHFTLAASGKADSVGAAKRYGLAVSNDIIYNVE